MAENQLRSASIRLDLRAECPLFSPKQTFANSDLDSVRMSAFGQKQPFAYPAYACILTVNQCPLSAKSGHSRLLGYWYQAPEFLTWRQGVRPQADRASISRSPRVREGGRASPGCLMRVHFR